MFSAYVYIVLLFMKRFVCNLHEYAAYLQYKEDTGRSNILSRILEF